MITLTLLAILALQPSQPPKQNEAAQKPPAGTDGQQAAPQPPPTITVVMPEKSAAELEQERRRNEFQDQISADIRDYTFWLVLIGAAQVLSAVLGFIAAKKAADAAKTSAEFAARSVRATQVTDRAYVKLSHESPNPQIAPIDFGRQEQQQTAQLAVDVTVKNEGATPADVLGGCLWYRIGAIDKPPADPPQRCEVAIAPAFLTGGGGDFVRFRAIMDFPFASVAHFQGYDPIGDRLWLLGYVDYRDRFGDFHRAGYCRHFDLRQVDLVFDQTTTGLNYDRPLSDEERQRYERPQTQ